MRVPPLPALLLERFKVPVSSCEFICHCMESDNSEEVKKGIIELIGSPDVLPKVQQPLPQEFEVIDQVNDRFHDAVTTSMKVFIFVVFNLETELFDRGLREVLESNGIQKVAGTVIHYGQKLDAERERLPQYLWGIQHCLEAFLNLTQEQLTYTRSRSTVRRSWRTCGSRGP